ncbi:Ankyrin repeat and BTB/POZ domain-containing protein 1 [Hondaea fermentalgiana]|uniref:Ankyrin repeat and BTB/POZ domain-containing protein 1 n=1 Tax=Hondaea fermentalgiana TaxID=2315210 RepID=A0A2R5G4X1_9STRA|nr:Ankyrin repeat and BTB/POZ domain-containing protein 1 [Hondaea fermentalgiana]|eukprot:GBG25595.1 Ankyrin repeat and BTB/POZ domain-containing protein 1 [Hondaea fermentalgiana]
MEGYNFADDSEEDDWREHERVQQQYLERRQREQVWMETTDDIFVACKAGLYPRVVSIVEKNPESVNLRFFDATPLYYACMAGHYEVCEFLLERGANCAEDSYDGDRCLYGALNDSIRNLLRQYSQRRTVVLSPLGTDIAKLEKDLSSADITIEVGDESFPCHRFMLAARVPRLARWLRPGGPWAGSARVRLEKPTTAPAFEALRHYIYTDVLECPAEDANALTELCKHLRLRKLLLAIDVERLLLRSVPQTEAHRQRSHTSTSGKVIFKMYPAGRKLPEDLGRGFVLHSFLADHTLRCQGKQFPVHGAIVAARSSYLGNLLKDSTVQNFRDTKTIHTYGANILHCALMFLYTGGPGCDEVLLDSWADDQKAREELLALLDLATAYLIPGLAQWIADCLVSHGLLDRSNVWDWLSLNYSYESASLRKVCFDTLGQAMAHDELSGVSIEPLVEALDQFLEAFCGDDAVEREFIVAEVREAFVEALPLEVSIERRDAITDNFEAALGIDTNP